MYNAGPNIPFSLSVNALPGALEVLMSLFRAEISTLPIIPADITGLSRNNY